MMLFSRSVATAATSRFDFRSEALALDCQLDEMLSSKLSIRLQTAA